VRKFFRIAFCCGIRRFSIRILKTLKCAGWPIFKSRCVRAFFNSTKRHTFLSKDSWGILAVSLEKRHDLRVLNTSISSSESALNIVCKRPNGAIQAMGRSGNKSKGHSSLRQRTESPSARRKLYMKALPLPKSRYRA